MITLTTWRRLEKKNNSANITTIRCITAVDRLIKVGSHVGMVINCSMTEIMNTNYASQSICCLEREIIKITDYVHRDYGRKNGLIGLGLGKMIDDKNSTSK